jgi:DNA-binding transcriptional LysR family regulator
VDVHLQTGATAGLIADVLERRLDGAFVTGPVSHPDLASECVFIEELAIAAPAAVATLEDLWALPGLRMVVFRHGCSYRRRLENLLTNRGISGIRTMQFGSLEAILECVAAGVGFTLLPLSVLSSAINQSANGRAFTVHRLAAAESYAETVFIRRVECHLSSAMAEFLSIARNQQMPDSTVSTPDTVSTPNTQRAA